MSHGGLMNPLLDGIFFRQGNVGSKLRDLRTALAKNGGNYSILVPKTFVLEWNVDRDSLLPLRDLCQQEDFLLSHVVEVPDVQRARGRVRYCRTFNGKTVAIKEDAVYSHKGFKHHVKANIVGGCLLTPGAPFLPVDAQFVTYELEVPLVGVPIPSKEITPTVVSKYQHIPESPVASPVRKSTSSPADDAPDLERISFDRLLPHYPTLSRLVSGPIMSLVEEFNCSDSKTEEDVLNGLDLVVEASIQVLQTGDRPALIDMASDHNLSGQNIADLIYRFVESNLSEKLWNQILAIRKKQDDTTRSVVEEIKYIDIGQIGLPADITLQEHFALDSRVRRASEALGRLNVTTSAHAKAEILMEVVKILGGHSCNAPQENGNNRPQVCCNCP
jgi:hypothetical protein